MGTFSKGNIVLVPFPFSDLSHSKRRPALVLADVGKDDYLLSQITSNPYGDRLAVLLDEKSFEHGTLFRISYVRLGKIFIGKKFQRCISVTG